MNKISVFIKERGIFNLIKIIIGSAIIIDTLGKIIFNGFPSRTSFPDTNVFILSLVSVVIIFVVWIILGIVLILSGLHKKKEENQTIYSSSPDISNNVFLRHPNLRKYLTIIFFVVCSIPTAYLLIIPNNLELGNIFIILDAAIILFLFLPLLFISLFLKNKTSLTIVNIILFIIGAFIFLSSFSLLFA